MIQHRAPKTQNITRILTILFPVFLFFVQLVARVSVVATVVAAILICIKALIELLASCQQQQPSPSPLLIEPCRSCGVQYDRKQLLLLTVAGLYSPVCQECYFASPVSKCFVPGLAAFYCGNNTTRQFFGKPHSVAKCTA